jgi:hypothetical protein
LKEDGRWHGESDGLGKVKSLDYRPDRAMPRHPLFDTQHEA